MDMFGSQFSYVGVELQLSYVITTCTYCDCVYTLLGALQPVLKFVKNIQNFGRVSLYFLLDFCHIFNFYKTVQKGLKARWKCLKFILKGLTFVFEPFLKS